MKKIFIILRSLIVICLFVLPIFILLRTDFPQKQSLSHNVPLCQGQPIMEESKVKFASDNVLSCLQDISLDTLYRTKSVEVALKADQEFTMKVSFRFFNREILATDEIIVRPKNGKVVVNYPLDNNQWSKLNRLSHSTHELMLVVGKIKNPPLTLDIDSIKLQ